MSEEGQLVQGCSHPGGRSTGRRFWEEGGLDSVRMCLHDTVLCIAHGAAQRKRSWMG